jgi:hypothetical protein
MGSDGMALPRHVGHRPVRHRPDRDRGLRQPIQPWVQKLLAALGQTLAAHGGTAGILRDHVPAPLSSWPGVDAVIVSTDNTLA